MSEFAQAAYTPQQNGVYQIPDLPVPGGIPDGFLVQVLDLAAYPDKAAFIAHLGQTLHFPEGLAHNWDALVDCLCDMEWQEATGYVFTFTGMAAHPESDVLWDVFAACADYWRNVNKPFFLFADRDDLPIFGL